MFGVYDIIETVGQGGMGVVYRAQDTALDRIVALKVLKEDLRQNKQVAARFQREAEAIASLNHPNIIQIYSVGSVGRIPYIAMEFIEGAPLSVVMKRVKSFPWKRALHIAEQVAEALDVAHNAHIIHRDIKPGNILIGANDHAYVTDFGIAKVLTAETQLTVEGSRLGTPHYMSPERCSKGDITSSSDLYSLGVVLFQLLCGRLPYEANSPVELIRKIVAEPPARISQYAQDIPEDVERLVAFLIEKKPPNRPKSAAFTAEMCRRVIEGEPLFEEGTVASSLRDFRDSSPTPSSVTTTHMDSASADAQGLLARIASVWTNIPTSARLWMAGVVVIAALAGAGQWTARRSFGDYALATVSRWDRSVTGWTDTVTPATISQESEGVVLAQCNFPGMTPSRIVSVGKSGFAVELSNQDTGQKSILVVHPETSSVQVGVPPTFNQAFDLKVGASTADGPDGAEEPYYFATTGPDPKLLRGDALLRNDAYGSLVITAEQLTGAIGARATKIRSVAVQPDGAAITLSLAAEGGKGEQVVRVHLAESGRMVIDPLLLDTVEVTSMAYNTYGDLYIAQHEDTRSKIVVIPAGAPGASAKSLTNIVLGVAQLTGDGFSSYKQMKDIQHEYTWQDFETDQRWSLGDVYTATVTSGSKTAIVSAQDRRGYPQLWLLRRDKPGERQQLTYITDGIESYEVGISTDGRYAIAVAHARTPVTFVLVDIEAAANANH